MDQWTNELMNHLKEGLRPSSAEKEKKLWQMEP
jgi:hypothetical protein